MTRILFITSTRIGDCVLSTGLYDRLAASEGNPSITVACGPLGAPVFRAAPALERIVVMEKALSGHRGHWIDLWRAVRRTRWDLVVDLRGSAIAWTLMAAKRRIHRGEAREPVHKVVELARVLSLHPPPPPVFWLDDKARADAQALLGSDPRPLLAVAPAAAVPSKAWPPARFAEVADRLTAVSGPMAGARTVVLGGPGDADAAAPLLARLGKARALSAIGRLDLPAAAAVTARARLFIGADSGMGHVAAAVGAPTLSLFGPTDERRYAPCGPHTTVVRGAPFERLDAQAQREGREVSQMGDLDVETVYRAAGDLLASSSSA